MSGDTREFKREAAAAAVAQVESGMVLGLGSGSTAALFIEELGGQLTRGLLSGIRGIPTSEESRRLAERIGIPLITFADAERCDMAVDGADEIDPGLNLIKGLGGALVREKIVAQNSHRLVIVADSSKLVGCLGSRCPLPVEVLPFGVERQYSFFRDMGGEPTLRRGRDGRPFVTDNGNHIIDVAFGPIQDPAALEIALLRRAGIVETGLFLGIATEAIIAGAEALRTMSRA